MHKPENLLQAVREHLPEPGTELGEFTFLAPDALWTGESEGHIFVAVAEDRWPVKGGMFLMVTSDGPVCVADLESYAVLNYCAAGFPQFMEIMERYLETVEADENDLTQCEEMEQVLRRQVSRIDPTAVADEESFWSTWLEELGVV